MNLSTFFGDSYYIKAGKETFYIKCFESGQWIRCRSEFEVDGNGCIKKIHVDSHNFDLIEGEPIRVATQTVNPFRHPRTVLHQFELAEQFIQYIIKKFKTAWWKSTRTLIFQLDYTPDGGLTDIELRAIRDSLEMSGAREIYIIKPTVSVSEHKVNALYQEISKKRVSKKTKLDPEWQSLCL